jgi:hypothetical protein
VGITNWPENATTLSTNGKKVSKMPENLILKCCTYKQNGRRGHGSATQRMEPRVLITVTGTGHKRIKDDNDG